MVPPEICTYTDTAAVSRVSQGLCQAPTTRGPPQVSDYIVLGTFQCMRPSFMTLFGEKLAGQLKPGR